MRTHSIALAALSLVVAARAQNRTIPGEVTTPYPTIHNLAIEWTIEGDDNRDGVVRVRYRRAGDDAWREAMPLRRVPAGRSQGTTPIFTWDNKHSGSIFDLEPDTPYEIQLRLEDPDGGSAERTVFARTRPEPRAAADAALRPASPGNLPATAEPGEIILLEPGSYGSFRPGSDGEPGRPVVYRSPDGSAVFQSVNLDGRRWIYLEGLTIINRDGAGVTLNGAEHCAVRRSKIQATYGVRASRPPGCANCYIADNVLEGVTPWTNEAMGANGANIGEGVQMTGPGNVIAFNRVKGFRDCISTMEDTNVHQQISIDIYNNDIYVGADDGIEADFCFHNCRVLRNRITNSFTGLSSQPGLGGPAYFIRNVMYNLTYVPFKLHRFSQGDVVLHNTTLKVGDGMACFAGQPFDFAFFRNNLSVGGPPGGVNWGGFGAGSGRAAEISAHGPNSSFDYDAVGTFQTPFVARIGGRDFFQVEPHGIRVDFGVFERVEFPLPPIPERLAADLRPRAGSAVIDAALRLPNVNDDFRGAGPDIGAYEAGQALPIYGPRPEVTPPPRPPRSRIPR